MKSDELVRRLLSAAISNWINSQLAGHTSPCGCGRCFLTSCLGFLGGDEVTSALLESTDGPGRQAWP